MITLNKAELICFQVVEHGMFVKHCKVEVYFIEFQLADNSDLEKTVKRKFSKSDTLGEPDLNLFAKR